MKIKVDCYSGYKENECPRQFVLGDRSIKVEEILDRWYGEDASYFRVLGEDENLYVLRAPVGEGDWDLVSFTHKDSRGTELGFEGKKALQ